MESSDAPPSITVRIAVDRVRLGQAQRNEDSSNGSFRGLLPKANTCSAPLLGGDFGFIYHLESEGSAVTAGLRLIHQLNVGRGKDEVTGQFTAQDTDVLNVTVGFFMMPADVDFKSTLPLIKDPGKTQYDAVYGAFGRENQRAVIDGDYKMILYPSNKTILLFDLSKDPLEMNDLAGKPESTTIKRRLFARLRELQRNTGDPLDLRPFYQEIAD